MKLRTEGLKLCVPAYTKKKIKVCSNFTITPTAFTCPTPTTKRKKKGANYYLKKKKTRTSQQLDTFSLQLCWHDVISANFTCILHWGLWSANGLASSTELHRGRGGDRDMPSWCPQNGHAMVKTQLMLVVLCMYIYIYMSIYSVHMNIMMLYEYDMV